MPPALGQHLLKDQNIIKKIIEAAGLQPDSRVLEIGPGAGALTKELVKKAKLVRAVELDANFVQSLPKYPNLEIIYGDFLQLDTGALFEGRIPLFNDSGEADSLFSAHAEQKQVLQTLESSRSRPAHAPLQEPVKAEDKWKVAANLPYYITTPIIEKLLSEGCPYIEEMILMVQKEAADRIQSISCRESGAFSYFVNYYAEAETLFTVKPGAFSPPPKVDSAVIRLRPRKLGEIAAPPKQLFQVTQTAFKQRRKTLRKSLQPLASSWRSDLDKALQTAQIEPSQRPEELTLLQFSKLTLALLEYKKA
ncbi:16S rRNA (adenine(1518)-N(6)/adenine(1519)-N(6))-dimethyltransferase [bacterium]|nr:16S rRNA (adenine(1518)-N(6)/adenine(1519)-N(6))-dimethyltransferase [bacterium]